VPAELPLLPLRNNVLYPGTTLPMNVGRERSTAAVRAARASGGLLAVLTQRRAEDEAPGREDLYEVGTVARIVQLVDAGSGLATVVTGVARFEVLELISGEEHDRVRIRVVRDRLEHTAEAEAARRTVQRLGKELIRLRDDLPDALIEMLDRLDDPVRLSDLVASGASLSLDERASLLGQLDVLARLRVLIRYLTREIRVAQVSRSFQERAAGEIDEGKRRSILRQQLRKIQEELGETDDQTVESDQLRERIEAAELPAAVIEVAEREVNRLAGLPPHAPDRAVVRTYIEWILDLPWQVQTEDNLDLRHARQILDEDHFGLERVKERILEYLAVRRLVDEPRGPILCFLGPPGVGKTSLGKSIARAMGRKFVRASLGGVRDEAEIRGHRRTYVGALPGRILQGLKTAGARNPVFMLDEIDKVGADYRGDPSSALLEVLDPEQNSSFSDHYLEIPFDLSNVLFLTTANRTDTIPPPLLDRMEVIELPGYTSREKLRIASEFLLPRQLDEHGIESGAVSIADEALLRVTEEYTREAGVRNLERQIAALVRKSALRVAEGESRIVIPAAEIPDLLGPRHFAPQLAERIDRPGVSIGLFWTPVGGEIMFVEATMMEGKPGLHMTGQLGDVMRESGAAALSWLRANAGELGIDPALFEKNEIHMHVPSGALRKDGPSAGLAITAALASLLLGRPTQSDLAMTGEITLRGQVLPVGGLKEKVLAAHRAGIRRLILPSRNQNDLEEVPQEVMDDLELCFVEQTVEALSEAIVDFG
jgi:ATP-dependent Lon protease